MEPEFGIARGQWRARHARVEKDTAFSENKNSTVEAEVTCRWFLAFEAFYSSNRRFLRTLPLTLPAWLRSILKLKIVIQIMIVLESTKFGRIFYCGVRAIDNSLLTLKIYKTVFWPQLRAFRAPPSCSFKILTQFSSYLSPIWSTGK